LSEETKLSIGKANFSSQVALADLSSHLHILMCIPPEPSMPLLMNIVQMLANYIKKTNHKILVNTAHMVEVTDRYSSVLSATSPSLSGDDAMTPIIEGFGRLNGVKISNQKIISSAEHFQEDLVDIVTTEHIDVLFFPWQIPIDHEIHDSTAIILFELLKICPASIGILVNAGFTGIINMSEAKILVPFFGGADDREAVELALSFGILTCIVSYTSDKLDEDDETLIKNVIHLSEHDPSVIYSVREFNEAADNAAAVVKEEYVNNHFSLIVLGRTSFPESQDPDEIEQVLGKLARKLLDQNLSLDLLVVSRGQNGAKFLNLEIRDD